MAEFAASKGVRLLFVGALLLALHACQPAYAGGHNGPGGAWGEGIESFYDNEPIKVPADVKGDTYRVPAMRTRDYPFPQHAPDLTLTFVPREEHYADIEFFNVLTNINFVHETVNFIRPDGRVVTVIFQMQDGDAPDLFTVIPPPGYVAIPTEMEVEENSLGVIEIHEATLG